MRNPGLGGGRPGIWLVRDSGARLRLPSRGLIFGRREDCDVVLEDPRASFHHALVVPTLRGVELIALGRNPTRVDGRRVERQALVRHGQSIELPGALFMVHAPFERRVHRTNPAWVLTHPDGHNYGIRQLPFSIGGSAEDDMAIEGWPPGVLCFYGVQGGMAVEVNAPVLLNEDELEAGAVEVVDSGDVFTVGRSSVKLNDAAPESGESTALRPRSPHPVQATFEFLPNGGRLHLTFADGDRMSVQLPELRARLIATLMSPSGGYEAGEYIPDDVLLSSIWPGNAGRGRTDLNVLIHRTRKSLMKAGINPTAVLARARQGRATCLQLAPGAKVEVK
jgi:pSer/pThr/pTyr-binding forkhead associated (FHA) protein